MVDVEESIIVDRSKPFVPDEIYYINYVVTNYRPILPNPQEYAEEEFDKATSKLLQDLRMVLLKSD